MPIRRYVAAAIAVATGATAAVVAVGVVRGPDAEPPPRRPAHTPDMQLSEATLEGVQARREPFCADIPNEVVTSAMNGEAHETAYDSGELAELEPGLTDVAHEFGCAFERDETVARAWVFAAPVTAGEARRLTRDARAEKGCTPTGPLRFGAPGTVLVCTDDTDRVLRTAGRLGDAWVHCELRTPTAGADPSFLIRGQQWCANVALTLAQ